MLTKRLRADHPNALHHAADVLRNGGLVAFPTDTVYGLAAMPFDAESVNRIYYAKGRSHNKAIAILLSNAAQLPDVSANPSAMAHTFAKKFWPGPLTLIVPRHPRVPDAVSSLPTIGVRIPDHPIALALFTLTGPLAVSSANRSDQANTMTAGEVLAQLDGRIHLILDGGRTPGGIPSTVVDCTTPAPVILRPGPVKLKHLKAALKT